MEKINYRYQRTFYYFYHYVRWTAAYPKTDGKCFFRAVARGLSSRIIALVTRVTDATAVRRMKFTVEKKRDARACGT